MLQLAFVVGAVRLRQRPGLDLVAKAQPNSLAEDVGLRPGDVIIQVDSEEEPSPEVVRQALRGKDRGDYLFLEVERGRHLLTFKIRM